MPPENENDQSTGTDGPAAVAPANGKPVGTVRQHRSTNPNAAGVANLHAAQSNRPKFDQEWADDAWAVMVPWILRGGEGTQSNKLEDVNISVVRRVANVEGGEQKCGIIRGHHVSGGIGTGVGADGGPGGALLHRMAEMHMGYDREAIYDLHFTWKFSGNTIAKKPMSFPEPHALAGMMRGLGAPPPVAGGAYNANRATLDGAGAGGSAGLGGYPSPQAQPGWPQPHGPSSAEAGIVGQLFEEIRQMRRERYEERLREYEKTGVGAPPAPPPGVTPPAPPSPEVLAMKAIVEQQAATIKQLTDALPKPPDPEIAKTKALVTAVAEMLGYKLPAPGVAGTPPQAATPAQPAPRPMTVLEAVNKRVSEANSLVEARDTLDAALKAIGVSGTPGVAEANAEVVEDEEKPEDALPFRPVKLPANGIFGQQEIIYPAAKEGEAMSFWQGLGYLVQSNPGVAERLIEVAGRVGEHVVGPLGVIAERLAEATKPGPTPRESQPSQATARIHSGPIPRDAQPGAPAGHAGVAGPPPDDDEDDVITTSGAAVSSIPDDE